MYDLNQIPYDYTVEVRTRFKGLDLIDRVPGELWNEVRDIVQGDRDQDHPHGKEMQKSKMAVWGGLTNSCEVAQSCLTLQPHELQHARPPCLSPTPMV